MLKSSLLNLENHANDDAYEQILSVFEPYPFETPLKQ